MIHEQQICLSEIVIIIISLTASQPVPSAPLEMFMQLYLGIMHSSCIDVLY